MRLEAEKLAPIENVTAKRLRAIILKLRHYGPSSFAALTDDDGNYLQVAGGGVTCMLERREASTGQTWRAFTNARSKAFPDGTILAFGGGELKLLADEWLMAPLVADAFEAFLHGRPLPEAILWREHDLHARR